MSLTAGERIFSLFKNLEVAQKFKNFCKKYDYTKKGRFRNVDIFINSQNMCIEIKSTWIFKKIKRMF